MSEELNDNSGPYNPDLKFEDFSKDFLISYIRELMSDYLIMAESWASEVEKVIGQEELKEIETTVWGDRIPDTIWPRIARLAGIDLPVQNIFDAMKVWQLVPDNTTADIYRCEDEIINDKHIVRTMTTCKTLAFYEKKMPHRIKTVCESVCVPITKGYCRGLNPGMQCEALKLPPRKSEDESPCVWDMVIP